MKCSMAILLEDSITGRSSSRLSQLECTDKMITTTTSSNTRSTVIRSMRDTTRTQLLRITIRVLNLNNGSLNLLSFLWVCIFVCSYR